LFLNGPEINRKHIRVVFTQIFIMLFTDMWSQVAVQLYSRRIAYTDLPSNHLGYPVGVRLQISVWYSHMSIIISLYHSTIRCYCHDLGVWR
jgi:hypothetical protein